MSTYTFKLVDSRGKLPVHPTRKYSNRSRPWELVIIHHSLTKSGSAEAFARYHVESNDWPGIGYHYVVNKDGVINWCWDHDIKSYHVGKHNDYCLGVCLVGNFLVQPLLNIQKYTLLWLLRDTLGVESGKVKGHSEMESYDWKDCPCINMNDLREDYSGFINK